MSDDNVVYLDVETRLDLPADRVLEQALGKMDHVVIVGYDTEGNEYFASSKADAAEVIFHLERAKYKLLRIIDGD